MSPSSQMEKKRTVKVQKKKGAIIYSCLKERERKQQRREGVKGEIGGKRKRPGVPITFPFMAGRRKEPSSTLDKERRKKRGIRKAPATSRRGRNNRRGGKRGRALSCCVG